MTQAHQDHLHDWQSNPAQAFRVFIQSSAYLNLSRRTYSSSPFDSVHDGKRQLSDASARIYIAMFNKLLVWLEQQKLPFLQMDSLRFFEFLNHHNEDGEQVFKSAIQNRYIRLIENIFDHLALDQNPARSIAEAATNPGTQLSGKDKASVFLNAEELSRVLAALPCSSAEPSPSRPHAGWKKRRDRAIQCVMIGAGLKVSEVIGLQIDEVATEAEADGSLRLSLTPDGKSDTAYEHDTSVRAELVPDILNWMRERHLLPVPGDLLFPGTHGAPLDKATVYSQVKRTFQRAGLELARMGGRTLRNTYALQELDQGTSLMELQEKMGLVMEKSVMHYQSLQRRSK